MGKRFCYTTRLLKLLLIALSILGMIFVVGCTRMSQEAEMQENTEPHGVQIELIEPLYPSAIGKETLNIQVYDADNQPIDNAKIKVRGDMTHAGMVPILAETENGDKGVYQVLFDWTMSGDWIVTVQVTLPDGAVIEKTFPRTIANDPANCEQEETKTP